MSSVYPARRALPEAAVAPAPAPASISGASAIDLEPELGSGIPPEDWVAARRATPAQLMRVARGKWISPLRPDSDQILGLIVNEGIVSREVALGRHVAFELLGPATRTCQPTPSLLTAPSAAGRPSTPSAPPGSSSLARLSLGLPRDGRCS